MPVALRSLRAGCAGSSNAAPPAAGHTLAASGGPHTGRIVARGTSTGSAVSTTLNMTATQTQ
eukprot:scaffold99010_cov63-Phaeocystis_antarctica.AAC.3